MHSPKVETEAKFIVPDRQTFATLQEVSELGDFLLKPTGSQVVCDRYLDTADRHLFKAGYACRIRNINSKQILTLKALSPPEANIHRRQEIETEIESDQPVAWADGEAKRLVLAIAGTAPLKILFNLYQTRHKFQALYQERMVLEFSLDEVSLGDSGTVDYFELEAELIETGTEVDLLRFTELLRRSWPLVPGTQSKFERALKNAKKEEVDG